MAPREMAIGNAVSVSHTEVYVNHDKFFIRLALVISILAGPAIYMLCNATIANFAQGQNMLALIAIAVMAFEMTWIVYGIGVLIHKARSQN